MRKTFVALVVAMFTLSSTAAWACGGLIGPRGSVNLLKTTTLAAYYKGIEHYITSFKFAGGGGAFGSLIPLPDKPSKIERGGDWTLQRLAREVAPPIERQSGFAALSASADSAQVVMKAKIDALDITVLKGGGDEVGVWAKDNGFVLPPDAPEVLDFYGRRSPYFMAAKFDADEAAARGQQVGDGTPIHLYIPTDNPWVPLRILGLGKQQSEVIEAEVFLLTADEPEILPVNTRGIDLVRSETASESLTADLRSDKGMDWMPKEPMHLSYLTVNANAGDLDFDLSIDAGGDSPSPIAAGMGPFEAFMSGGGGEAIAVLLVLGALIFLGVRTRRIGYEF